MVSKLVALSWVGYIDLMNFLGVGGAGFEPTMGLVPIDLQSIALTTRPSTLNNPAG